MKWVKVIINGHEVSVAFDTGSIHIYNSYPIKDDLKSRGYRWNPGDKSWYINPSDIDGELAALKNNLLPVESPISLIQAPTQKSSQLAAFPESLSVADLRNRIDKLIREGLRGNIWVRGVVASDVKHYNWASYLDLKDEDDSRDMFFRMEVKKQHLDRIIRKLQDSGVAEDLEKDLPLFCNVDVHLPLKYVVDVRLQLLDILPEYTQSKIRNQLDITLETLKNEGILENQKQIIVPAYIRRVGLITSAQGTSVKDIKAGLHPFTGRYDFYFADSRMEGNNAVDSILNALDRLADQPGLDVVIIARGGGSEQSLAVFNDLRLCRRICTYPIPVMTAIGHEKDVSAIERCSWLTPTPSTPSGIGKYLQNRYVYLQDQLATTITQLMHRFSTRQRQEVEKINGFLKHIPSRARSAIKWREERFFSLTRGLEQSMAFFVRDQERRINDLSKRILEKCNATRNNQVTGIQYLGNRIVSRTTQVNLREEKHLYKTAAKLDFEKRRRLNRTRQDDLVKHFRSFLTLAARALNEAEKDLHARSRLVRASDPRNILEKGFALVLDDNGAVIPSANAFKKVEKATLRFHDGTAPIVPAPGIGGENNRKENNNENSTNDED